MPDKSITNNSPTSTNRNPKLLALIKGAMPENKDQQLTEAVVLEVGERTVLLSAGLKADGVISLNEFKDTPTLKKGDKVEIYIEKEEGKNDELVISRKKAKELRGWQTIEDAFKDKKTLLGTVEKRVKGGLEVSINGIRTFLPGSQIDTSPVTDFDALLKQQVEVTVLSIKPNKSNAVVSRRAILEHEQKNLIDNLQEGQVLEGTVKNITNFGVFVELATNIVGLVYVKETVWDKKISHPDQAKDENNNPMFEVGKPVKVAVKGFESQEGSTLPRIALSTKALMPNPWDTLPEGFAPGAEVKGKVTDIKDRGICVTLESGFEGFVHISEMSHSTYTQNPGELVELGQEVMLKIIKVEPEVQDIRLSMKQLISNPWDDANFQEKYGLNTHHKASVRRFGDKGKGTYLELSAGVEGYLDNEHISWTQKILRASEYFKIGQAHEVIILGSDDERKLLKLGMRELEDSPWDAFEKNFQVGSEHDGVVQQIYNRGAIIELPYGLQAFVPNKEIQKEDKSPVQPGETLKFRIMDFIKYEHKVMLSHLATYKEPQAYVNEGKPSKRTTAPSMQKSTLSDLGALSKLKAKLIGNEEPVNDERKEGEPEKKARKEGEPEQEKKEDKK